MLRGKFSYDLIVVGAGSGGVRAARIAATHGAKVALIETSLQHNSETYTAIGGTCVNVGCVPKKLFLYGAQYNRYLKEAQGFGWSLPEGVKLEHSWETLVENKNKEISRLNAVYQSIFPKDKVDILEGTGKLLDRNTVEVKMKYDSKMATITGETILIAVGGWPYHPDIPGIEHAITSNEIFYMKERPKRVTIVGGGYIAVEFANILDGYGSKVDLLYRRDLFLDGFDKEIREFVYQQMLIEGINVRNNTSPTKLEKNPDGTINVHLNNGDVIETDCVFYATGRRAKTEGLGLERVGVKLDQRGNIVVDEYSRSNVDNIYAVGDVTNRLNLTPVALHEGHCFADTLYGKMDRKPDHEQVCSAVFALPEIGTCGLTEEAAVEKFKNVTVYTSKFRPMKYSFMRDHPEYKDRQDLLKIIVSDKDEKVVGLHIAGINAAEILQGFGVAIKMGATKSDFDRTIGIHPTSAEELVTMRTPKRKYINGELQSKI